MSALAGERAFSCLVGFAPLLPGEHLRSLDALHIAAALRVGADVMVSYDQRQIDAAREVGLHTLSPG